MSTPKTDSAKCYKLLFIFSTAAGGILLLLGMISLGSSSEVLRALARGLLASALVFLAIGLASFKVYWSDLEARRAGERDANRLALGIPLGMTLGAGVGTAVGTAVGDLVNGIGLGVGVGIALGVAFGSRGSGPSDSGQVPA